MNKKKNHALSCPRRWASRRNNLGARLRGHDNKGFTLLEVILALSILATIGIITINILAGQIQTRQKIGSLNNDEHSLNAALSRLTKDLQGAYLSNQTNIASLNLSNRPIIPQFYVRKDNLIFFTMAFKSYLNGSNQSNQAYVRYYAETNPKDSSKKQLIRVVDTDLVDSIEQNDVGLSQVLLDDIEGFTVQYWDGNKFNDEWTSLANETQNKLPKLVKIHLSSYSSENKEQIKSANQDIKRQIYTLDTIVYLNNTKGQKEASTPIWADYTWN